MALASSGRLVYVNNSNLFWQVMAALVRNWKALDGSGRLWTALDGLERLDCSFELARSLPNDQNGLLDHLALKGSKSCFVKYSFVLKWIFFKSKNSRSPNRNVYALG